MRSVLLIDAVVDDLVEAPREIGGAAVGEMPAVGEVHAQDRVPRLQDGEVDGHVGLGARVRLDVRVVGPEELLGPLDGERLDDVDELAAVVVSLARVSLGVLVGHDASLGLEDRLVDEVLRRDELQLSGLSLRFLQDGGRHLGIDLLQHGHRLLTLLRYLQSFCSSSRILSRRFWWRPPSKGVSSHVLMIRSAAAASVLRPASTRMFESLCCRLKASPSPRRDTGPPGRRGTCWPQSPSPRRSRRRGSPSRTRPKRRARPPGPRNRGSPRTRRGGSPRRRRGSRPMKEIL